MDNKLKILIISAAVLIIGGIGVGLFTNSQSADEQSDGSPELTIEEARFDFGTIKMADGLAKHSFQLENTGTADLEINSIKTSCMCTEAVLEVDGQKSPTFGMHSSSAFWSESIKPGQTANLEVTFDPNAHGPNATGPITRTVTLSSNHQNRSNNATNITFSANVIK